MAGFNMPRGTSPSNIPGNSAEDAAWEQLMEKMGEDSQRLCLRVEEAYTAWQIGIEAYSTARKHFKNVIADAVTSERMSLGETISELEQQIGELKEKIHQQKQELSQKSATDEELKNADR